MTSQEPQARSLRMHTHPVSTSASEPSDCTTHLRAGPAAVFPVTLPVTKESTKNLPCHSRTPPGRFLIPSFQRHPLPPDHPGSQTSQLTESTQKRATVVTPATTALEPFMPSSSPIALLAEGPWANNFLLHLDSSSIC